MTYIILNAVRGKEKLLIEASTIERVNGKDGDTVCHVYTANNVYTVKHTLEELQEMLNKP